MAQPKSRLPLLLGLTAAGGVGYYLYSAGGDPKVAQKKLEADVSKVSASIKSEVPGKAQEAQKKGEVWAAETGAKIDAASTSAKAKLVEAGDKFDQVRKDVGKDAMAKVDKFDATVEKEVAKAKSGISSWFGFK